MRESCAWNIVTKKESRQYTSLEILSSDQLFILVLHILQSLKYIFKLSLNFIQQFKVKRKSPVY